MKTDAEKRASERHCFAADIMVSYFNKKHSYNAEILNLGMGGICFKSSLFLLPGATVYIRLMKIHPNGSCSDFCEGLRSVALAEVKWCNEMLDAETFPYSIGAKYYGPVY